MITMREYGKGNRVAGVPKDNEKTMKMTMESIEWLHTKRIHVSDPLLTGQNADSNGMLRKLHSQMAEYTLNMRTKPDDPFFQPKYKWAGAKNDDLLIAVMMLIFWHQWFWLSDFQGYEPLKRLVLRERSIKA